MKDNLIAKPNVARSAFLHEKINKLMPFISENFITYPLWEEGKYIPFVNFWKAAETEEDFLNIHTRLGIAFKNSGYVFDYYDNNSTNTLHYFNAAPDFKELENGSYEFVKEDWSLEEMIEILGSALS